MVGQGQGKGPDALFNAIDWQCRNSDAYKAFRDGANSDPPFVDFHFKNTDVITT